eukprot:CAMPEP_0204344310 /NCGR_PEP_ID=MMETSP0469-20131031/25534_1 /ASSEMBLY_ACC=CAM_ASM_000384 /TAXON_ID=2969 /ORGANISM="Oxyrrhis marina" /LENGTH=116 /DNA_ID=CAMNT_0051329555 /DNA_START=365 /DNA_END=715 /DNA_ORIENTATION=+
MSEKCGSSRLTATTHMVQSGWASAVSSRVSMGPSAIPSACHWGACTTSRLPTIVPTNLQTSAPSSPLCTTSTGAPPPVGSPSTTTTPPGASGAPPAFRAVGGAPPFPPAAALRALG